MSKVFLFTVVMVLAALSPSAQPTNALAFPVIAPARRTNWTTVGVEGGVPSRTECVNAACNALDDDVYTLAELNTAIAGAPANTYVLLPAGSHTFTGSIDITRNNVTLRGSGADQTFLTINGGGASCGIGFIGDAAINVCLSGAGSNFGNNSGVSPRNGPVSWSALYTQGTTTITLASHANLVVGSMIMLEQAVDTVDGYPGTGDVFVCEGGPTCSADGTSAWTNSGFEHVEVHEVTACGTSTPGAACSSNSVTIDPPVISPDFRSGKSPQAWWGTKTSDTIEGAGIEDLSIDWSSQVAGPAIILINAMNSWVRGVRLVFNAADDNYVSAIYGINVFRLSFQSNYLYGSPPAFAPASNTNYPMTMHLAGQILYENNIFHAGPNTIVPNGAEVGSVAAYNYADNVWYGSNGYQHHNNGDMYNLQEGNNWGQVYCDNNHGGHFFNTYFRNHLDHLTNNPDSSDSTDAGFALLTHCRFANIVGNVLTAFTTYEVEGSENGNAVFELGNNGDCSNCASMADDTNVKRTLYRWGNWDVVTSTDDTSTNSLTGIRWCGSASNTNWAKCTGTPNTEVPSAITNYPQYIPKTQSGAISEVLPASLYLSAKPAWFGSVAWPPIGPDVTSGNYQTTITGGHANKIPAKVCFDSLSNDGGYGASSPRIKVFNRVTCYGA